MESYMRDLTWKATEKKYEDAYYDTDTFFEMLNSDSLSVSGINLSYRPAQNTFALDVMEAIKRKKILLVEAGVGTGKSFGYLIPIFYTFNNVPTFDKIIISTSSITLEEQLMKDIERVSTILGIKIKAWLAKGMNNYVCLKKINEILQTAHQIGDAYTVSTLQRLLKEMNEKGTADKSQLVKIDKTLWKKIQIDGKCSRCSYKNQCLYQSIPDHIINMPIIVTNHVHLASMIEAENPIISSASMIVCDEVHNLEDSIRLQKESSVSLNQMANLLNFIDAKIAEFYNDYEIDEYRKLKGEALYLLINKFAVYLRANSVEAKNRCLKHGGELKNDKIPFTVSNENVQRAAQELLFSLKNIVVFLNCLRENYVVKQNANELNQFVNIIQDLTKQNKSENIYWSRLLEGPKGTEVELCYTKKDINSVLEVIYSKNIPVVLTSGTMTINGEYDYLKSSLNLSDNKRVEEEFPLQSPFDYKNNSIFYYAKDAVSPKCENRTSYLEDICTRIKDLIELTEGKALVLFTSKKDMTEMYNIISNMGVKQKLLLQGSKTDKELKYEFMEDEDSCLFATGAFWEGVDLKGPTLSNLIVVRLPFPVQDRVVEYKKESCVGQEKHEIDTKEMLKKLAQGAGRLIRSQSDVGIIACLDPRIERYLPSVKNTLPFENFTSDLEEVESFVQKKIIQTKSDQAFTFKPIN